MTSVVQKEVSCRENPRDLQVSCLFLSLCIQGNRGISQDASCILRVRISSSLTFLDLRLQLMSSSTSSFSGEDVNVIMNRNTIVFSRLMCLLLWYSSSLHEEGSRERCVSLFGQNLITHELVANLLITQT